MDAAKYKAVSDYFGAEEENEEFFRLEEAVHEISHYVICNGNAGGLHLVDTGNEVRISPTSKEIDDLVNEKYPTSYQQDLHELRTSMVTALALRLLLEEDCPDDVVMYCYDSALGNLLTLPYGYPTRRQKFHPRYSKMEHHQSNHRRAKMVAACVRDLLTGIPE